MDVEIINITGRIINHILGKVSNELCERPSTGNAAQIQVYRIKAYNSAKNDLLADAKVFDEWLNSNDFAHLNSVEKAEAKQYFDSQLTPVMEEFYRAYFAE